MVAIKSINRLRLSSANQEDNDNANEKKENTEKKVNRLKDEGNKIKQEYNIMAELYHENIVKCYEKLDTPTHTLFIMELCQGGNLLNYVRRRQRLTEAEARHFFE